MVRTNLFLIPRPSFTFTDRMHFVTQDFEKMMAQMKGMGGAGGPGGDDGEYGGEGDDAPEDDDSDDDGVSLSLDVTQDND